MAAHIFCYIGKCRVISTFNFRSVCSSTSLQCYKGMPEDNALKKYIRQHNLSSEDIHAMIQRNHDPDEAEEFNGSLDAITDGKFREMEYKNRNTWKKIIEKKYFSDLYRIKPGEVYSRKKDPYFKKVTDNSDFQHSHHKSKQIRNRQEFTVPVPSDESHKISKSPLNMMNRAHDMYPEERVNLLPIMHHKYNKNDSLPSLPSPEEAYINSTTSGRRNKATSIMHEEDTFHDEPFQTYKSNTVTSDMTTEESSEILESFSSYSGPCLLLWSMKEQMRYLHHTDVDLWTPAALSQIFPMSPENINKLLTSRRQLKTDEQISKHDRSVLEQWRKLDMGRLGSSAIVRRVVRDRCFTGSTESEVAPIASSADTLQFLDNLIFDQPESARDLGVYRGASPEKRIAPRYGYFVDIIKKYKSQVDNLDKSSSGQSRSQDLLPSNASYLDDLTKVLPKIPSYEEVSDMVQIFSEKSDRTEVRRVDTTRPTIYKTAAPLTYDEFIKTKKSASETQTENDLGKPTPYKGKIKYF